MENSLNSSEKAERQPSAESGLVAETSTISQVPAARPQQLDQSSQEPGGVIRDLLEGVSYFCFLIGQLELSFVHQAGSVTIRPILPQAPGPGW
jgi:hypothetical protein